MKIKVGNKFIGDGEPCFIIAEAGSNHNKKLDMAKKLIDVAADADADAVKFQLFKADKLYVGKPGFADYLENKKSIYEIIKNMEFPVEWLDELFSYADKRGLLFLATPFHEEAVDVLDGYVPAHKIASYESNHIPLIKYAAKKRKPLFISTGASTLEEICEAVEAARSVGNENIVLLQCVAKYPAPINSLNLNVIRFFKKKFHIPAGLSDHSRDPLIGPLTSIGIGANVIEKHFTLDNKLPGPDHKFAVEPKELKRMVFAIREAEKALGKEEKQILSIEQELYDFAKRAVHVTRDIKKNEIFSQKNIAVLRPGKVKRGLPPKFFEKIIGKKSTRDIFRDEGVLEGDYE